MSIRADQRTELKFVVTNTLIVADTQKSLAFYRDVFGVTVLDDGEPTLLTQNPLQSLWDRARDIARLKR